MFEEQAENKNKIWEIFLNSQFLWTNPTLKNLKFRKY